MFTQIKPDEPFFIKSNYPFRQAYKDFVMSKFFESDFLVSPKPKLLEDIILNKKNLKVFFAETLKHSQDMIKTHSIFVAEMKTKYDFEINNFFGPLLWSHNNTEAAVVVGDYPHMLWLNYLAKSVTMADFKDMITEAQLSYDHLRSVKALVDNNFAIFNSIRIDYMHKVLLQCVSSNPKTIAVVGSISRQPVPGVDRPEVQDAAASRLFGHREAHQ